MSQSKKIETKSRCTKFGSVVRVRFSDSDSDAVTVREYRREDVLLGSTNIYSAMSSMDNKFTFSRYGNRKSTETIKQKVVKIIQNPGR